MQAGAAYNCSEPSLAPDRSRFLVEDSHAVAVIARSADRGRIEALGVAPERIVVMDGPTTRAGDGATALRAAEPSSLAYVIYTSGTSGRPKGVMIEHRSVTNLVESDRH